MPSKSFKKKRKEFCFILIAFTIVLAVVVAISFPFITGLITATVPKEDEGTLKMSLPLEFDKEYANVKSIAFEGRPGGAWCAAGIKIEAYDGSGAKVGEWTAGRVDVHQTTSNDVNINPHLNIKKIVGRPNKDNFWDCAFIDYLKATMTYDVPEDGETTGLEGTKEISKDFSQTYKSDISLDFEKEYADVQRITLFGRPGGGACDAKIRAEVYDDAGNNVATIITDPAGAQEDIIKYVNYNENPLKVRRVVGETYGTGACWYLDYLKATLNYREAETATVPETITAASTDTMSPWAYASVDPTSVTSPNVADEVKISATAGDDVGITKIEIYVDDNLAKACLDTTTCVTNGKAYSQGVHNYMVNAYDAAGNTFHLPKKNFNVLSVMTYQLSVSVANSGRVTSSPSGINCTNSCNKLFEKGKQVTLTATPSYGATFKNWDGGVCSGTNPICTFTMNSGKMVKATFSVQNIPLPVASIRISPETGTAPLTVSLWPTASSANGEIKEYRWNFGDGKTSTVPYYETAQHTYSAGGTYTVELSVTDAMGMAASAMKMLSVAVAAPVIIDTTAPSVTLTVPKTSIMAGESLTISATANDNVALKFVRLIAGGSVAANEANNNNIAKECMTSDTKTKQLTCSHPIYYLTTGTYTISADTFDLYGEKPSGGYGLSGNANPVSITVTPDTSPPKIESTLQIGESTKLGTMYSINAKATDGIGVAKIEMGSKEKIVKTCTFSPSPREAVCLTGYFNPVNYGRFYSVTAYDVAGNKRMVDVTPNDELKDLFGQSTSGSSEPTPLEKSFESKIGFS